MIIVSRMGAQTNLVRFVGKTSLLMSLLGEMHFKPQSIDSFYNLPRENGIAYAAQEAWIQNATIKVRL